MSKDQAWIDSVMRKSDEQYLQGKLDNREQLDAEGQRILGMYTEGMLSFDDALERIQAIDNARANLQTAPQPRPAPPADGIRTLLARWPIVQNIRAGVLQERDASFRVDLDDYSITPARLLERLAKESDAHLYKKLRSGELQHGEVMFQLCRDWSETNTANQLVSEFPAAIYEAFGKAVSNGYENVREPLADLLLRHCTRPVANFRAVQMFLQSELPQLQTVAENGSFPNADLAGDAGESGQVITQGVIMNLTRQALVNQDFMLPLVNAEKAGKASKMAISSAAVTLLADAGGDIFTAPRGNLAAAPAAPSVGEWENVCSAMGGMTGPNGQVLNIHPSVLLTGCAYESTAATLRNANYAPLPGGPLLTDYTAGSFEVIADARIADDSWIAMADPRQLRFMELLYLEGGAPEPVVEFSSDFTYDAVQARVRVDYGVAFSDYRGAYRYPATP